MRNRQPRVLGLCSFTHDSAAALIADGNLTGMAEEERLSGVKHTREYPVAAVEWLLSDAGISEADIVQMSQTNPAKLLGLKP